MKKTVSLFLTVTMTLMLCGVKAQTIFFEDFSYDPSVTTIPDGWTVYGDTLHNAPYYSNYNQSWQLRYPDGTSKSGEAFSVTHTTEYTIPCSRWLITPRIALPADTVMSLLFKHHAVVFGEFSVRLSTTGTDTSDFVEIMSYVMLQPEVRQEHRSLAEFAGDSVYIAFVNNISRGSCSQYMVLDDIEVKHLPENSIGLDDITMPSQAAPGQPLTVSLKVKNDGRNHVANLHYSYRIGNADPVENTVNCNIWPCQTRDVNISIVPTQLGVIPIEFRVSQPNGAEDYDSTDNRIVRILTVTNNPVGIESVAEKNRPTVSPNPFQDKVTISFDGNVSAAWVSDMMGRREEVRLVPLDDGRYTLDLSSRPRGAYLLTLITAAGQQHTVKMVKQ